MRFMLARAIGLLLASLFFYLPAFAEKDFSSWRKFSQGALVSETTAFTPDSTATLGLYITLAEHWHTYWLNPGDSGAAVRLNLRPPPGVHVKQVHFPAPERVESGPLISFAYSRETLFLIELEVDKSVREGQNLDFVLDAEWLICEDVCIPAIDTLKISVPVRSLAEVKPGEKFALFQKTRALVPQLRSEVPNFVGTGDDIRLTLPLPFGHEFVDFFPFRNSGVNNEKPEVVLENPFTLKFKSGTVKQENPQRVGVLVSRDSKSKILSATQFGDSGWRLTTPQKQGGDSVLWMLLWAFLGGLILNLMPCVFPILSIKLLSLLKLSSAHPEEVRRQNFAYVAGVLISFIGIALALSLLRSAGHLIGWGFQLQSPVFLTLLIWLFFVLGLNLLGVFELDFLNAGMGSRLTRIGGVWGSFFTGVLAVVVASPCTAPFMGVALGFGLTQSWWILLAVFTMLGLGLASPYLVFAVFPRLIRALPKPGRWMNILKQVMAFPLFLTTLWLLWILAQVRGPNAVIVVLAGCVVLGFAFWLSSWRKNLAKILAITVLLGGVAYIYRLEKLVETQVNSGLWQPFNESLMENLRGQKVFVNLTADWCLTCKVNERLVFNDPEVQGRLTAKKIIMVKGDWTQRNEEITRFLTRFDRVGVPFYVFYSDAHPDGLVLPEVLTKNTFLELIEKEFP